MSTQIDAAMRLPRLYSMLILALGLFTGCSQSPSVADGQKEIQGRIISQSLKLVSFRKTDGQKGQIENAEGVAVQSYSLAYEAEIEATQRCELLGPEDRSTWLTTIGEDNSDFPIYTENVLNVGQRFKMYGTIVFEKTENGWRAIKADKKIYTLAPQPAEAAVGTATVTESSCADVIYDALQIELQTIAFDESRRTVPSPTDVYATIKTFKADVKKHPVLADLNGPQQDLAVACDMVVLYADAFGIDCQQCLDRGNAADFQKARGHCNSLTNACQTLSRQLGDMR
jgi:hypothetical protein